MPVISMFYGLIVTMYFLDTKKHNLPHIHVRYQNYEAVYGIETSELLEGSLPINKERILLAWIELHRDELLANWSLAIEALPLFKIDPLK
ncbi:DUF4160 domain-containing protein [bacterium]|nr:DUF4160 domain-containing protein [bacterium]